MKSKKNPKPVNEESKIRQRFLLTYYKLRLLCNVLGLCVRRGPWLFGTDGHIAYRLRAEFETAEDTDNFTKLDKAIVYTVEQFKRWHTGAPGLTADKEPSVGRSFLPGESRLPVVPGNGGRYFEKMAEIDRMFHQVSIVPTEKALCIDISATCLINAAKVMKLTGWKYIRLVVNDEKKQLIFLRVPNAEEVEAFADAQTWANKAPFPVEKIVLMPMLFTNQVTTAQMMVEPALPSDAKNSYQAEVEPQ